MKIEILKEEEMALMIENLRPLPIVGLLLAGDRLSCCDEAVAMRDEAGRLLGLATLAPRGEDKKGAPMIVGLYVLPQERGKGHALGLLRGALARCQERGFTKVQMEVFSGRLARTIERLSSEEKAFLEVRVLPQELQIDFLADLENQ